MDFRLISANEGLDIMPFVSGLKWNESIDTLGLEMSFTLPDNFNDKNFNFLDNITLGSGLSLFKGNEIITQVIIVEEGIIQEVSKHMIMLFGLISQLLLSNLIRLAVKMQ